MNLLSTLAATYTTTSSPSRYSSYATTSSSADQTAVLAAVAITMIVFTILLCVALYVVQAIFTMKLFKKANVAAWKAWVPFVNIWAFLQIGGQKGAWTLGAIIAIPIYVVMAIMTVVASTFGSSDAAIAFSIIAVLMYFVALVGIILTTVFQCIAAYNIGKKLGFDSGMVVLYIFISIVWLGIAGLGKAKFDNKKGKPSLAPTV